MRSTIAEAIIAVLFGSATISNAIPTTSAALVGEDKPWQLYNLSVIALPTTTTQKDQTQHVTFTVEDTNTAGGLNFTSACSRSVPAGQSLFSDGYTACDFKNAGFSLQSDGTLNFHRAYANGQAPPYNYTVCNGKSDLSKLKSYSNGSNGMTVSEDYLEIACTLMS